MIKLLTKFTETNIITSVINNVCYLKVGDSLSAKKQVTKEKILITAVEIVRKEGIDALNMRTLAAACKCSTQPIYLSFKGMEELQTEVAKKSLEIFNNLISSEIADGKYPEYKAVGMGYIRFAKEEKALFKYLLMNNGMNKSGGVEKSFDDSVYMIMKNYGLYRGSAQKLHMQMWIFVHGIASMFATDYIDWDWETVSQMVTDAYKGFTQNFKGEINDN